MSGHLMGAALEKERQISAIILNINTSALMAEMEITKEKQDKGENLMARINHPIKDFGNLRFVGEIDNPTQLTCHRDYPKQDNILKVIKQIFKSSDEIDYCLGTQSQPLPYVSNPFDDFHTGEGESNQYRWVWFRSKSALKQFETLENINIEQKDDWFRIKSSNLVLKQDKHK